MKSKIINELKRIARDNGGLLQPESVVENARPKSSPLHSRFEWDDSLAGHQYRLWQARNLIRICVEVKEGSNEKIDVFVSLTPDRNTGSGGYRIMTEVLSDEDLRKQMLADALAELQSFSDKYKKLKQLSAVFAAIKKTTRKFKRD